MKLLSSSGSRALRVCSSSPVCVLASSSSTTAETGMREKGLLRTISFCSASKKSARSGAMALRIVLSAAGRRISEVHQGSGDQISGWTRSEQSAMPPLRACSISQTGTS